jgi:hypothetical protein
MYDLLGRVIFIKVFSHQLNNDFTLKDLSKLPSPNMFVASANQHADNAATQAKQIIDPMPDTFDSVCYPAFSP